MISSSKLSRDQTSNPTSSTNLTPKGRIHRSSKQKVENSHFEEHLTPIATMTDNRTMAEMLCAPTEGCAEAIVVPPILAEQFKLKHSLINMMTSEQFFGLEKDNPHDHIRAARRWLEKEPPHSITTWDDLISKFINEFFPPHELQTFVPKYQIFNKNSMNLFMRHEKDIKISFVWQFLRKSPQDALTIIENKSKVKAVEEICVTCEGAHPYYQFLAAGGNTFLEFRDNIQGYVSAAAGNYNQGNPGYRPQGVANQMRPPGSRSLSGNTVANPKGELKAITTRSGLVTDGPTVPTPPKFVTPEENECVEETYTDPELAEYTIKVPPPPVQKHKPPVQRNFVLHTRDSPLPNIPELKCKALADLGASINLMPLSVWKKLGLPDLIPTCMTLELANHAICTPDGITRDVFIPVGKFIFPADFVVVDYESDPRVPLILGRPFLRTARALIDVYGEEMILRDGDERLTLNMQHDTASYSNHPHRESANLINIFNVPSEDCLEDLISNQQSGNPTFSLHKKITSPKVTHEIHDSEGCNFLSEELPDIDSFNDIHPYFDDNPLSGSTTYSSNSLLEVEIEFLLYQGKDSGLKDSIDQTDLANLDDYFVDPTLEMFNDEHAPDYSFPPRFDVYDDDFLEVESDADNFYDDPFDSKGEKIKESELLIDELDLPCDFLPYPEYDSFASQDFSRDDDLPSPNNEDKKLAISYASLVFEDSDPPIYEPLVFKDVPNSMRLLPFSSENEEKVFKPEIYTSEKVHSCFLPELSHPDYHVFKVNHIFISLMRIFHVQSEKNTPLLDVLLFHFYPP
nr:reverse transcriptase domain-containing protein [Tanacetum cinerariifolium]